MPIKDELRAAINDIWANEARHPERIYLGLNQKKQLKAEVSLIELTQLQDVAPMHLKVKITKQFDGVNIYYVNEDDHFHVC